MANCETAAACPDYIGFDGGHDPEDDGGADCSMFLDDENLILHDTLHKLKMPLFCNRNRNRVSAETFFLQNETQHKTRENTAASQYQC